MTQPNNQNQDRERDLAIKILVSCSLFFLLLGAIFLEAATQSIYLPSP